MTRSDIADGTLVLWPGAATDLANPQGLAMAVLYLRLVGGHALSAAFTVDADYKAFAVSALMLFKAQRGASQPRGARTILEVPEHARAVRRLKRLLGSTPVTYRRCHRMSTPSLDPSALRRSPTKWVVARPSASKSIVARSI